MLSNAFQLSARLRTVILALVPAAVLGISACTAPEVESYEFEQYAEAVQRFAQPDSVLLRVYSPNDLKAESKDAAWIVDPGTGAVFRIEPPRGDYRQMGIRDEPPAEIQNPAKIAVSKEFGVFTFDLASNRVHLFSPGGEHLRSFEPGYTPSRFELVRKPVGLVFGLVDRRDEQSPRLTVIRTDSRGQSPDTLLHAGSHGPPSMWKVVASSGELSLDGSESGLWAWAMAVPDTVFEITDDPEARKRILRMDDRMAKGILTDLERGILWVAKEGENPGELVLVAYDAVQPGTMGPEQAYLGERTISDFTPWDAIDGTIMGFSRTAQGRLKLASYDMKVPPARK
jgi:hypothetical protein